MTEAFADGRITLTPGPVARLVLDAPATRNAMSQAMWAALPQIAARIGADPAIRVLVISGAGGAFCAGADIGEFAAVYTTPQTGAAYNAQVRAGQAALRAIPQPVVAMIDGACIGGGCGIALSCDLRFAAPGASFAITPVRLGIAYSPADTMTLMEKVGAARAKDMLFSARKLDAAEALAIGLIDRVADPVEPATLDYAQALCRLSPASLRATKAIINGLSRIPGDDPADPAAADAACAALFAGPDFAEGRTAFLAKRPPEF